MGQIKKGPVRLVAAVLAAVVLSSLGLGVVSEEHPRFPVSWRSEQSEVQAQTAPAVTLYLPFLAKIYATGPSVLGIDMGDADDETKARLVAEAGATWVRMGIDWSRVEASNTTPDNFNWSDYDQMFARVARWGLSPIVVVTGNPSWAADTTCGPINRTSLQEFAQFLTAAVSRYSRQPYGFKYWELYNEPDNSDSANRSWLGGCWGNNGREYGQMLQAVYPAIKTADLGAKVVLGSLAYDWFSDNMNGPFVRGFLDDVLNPQKGNGGPFFDVFGFHYYYLFRAFWEPYGKDLMGKTNFLRTKLSSYGLSKPMILTEVGIPAGTAGQFQGSDEMQSDYVVKAFVRSMAAGMKIAIWFSLMDFDGQKLGLVNGSTPKQSYEAFKALTTQLSGTVYQRPVDAAAYPGVEGYVFTAPGGTTEKWVLWSSGDNPVAVTLAGVRLNLADKLGRSSVLSDGDDGNWDGKLNVRVTSSPVCLELLP